MDDLVKSLRDIENDQRYCVDRTCMAAYTIGEAADEIERLTAELEKALAAKAKAIIDKGIATAELEQAQAALRTIRYLPLPKKCGEPEWLQYSDNVRAVTAVVLSPSVTDEQERLWFNGPDGVLDYSEHSPESMGLERVTRVIYTDGVKPDDPTLNEQSVPDGTKLIGPNLDAESAEQHAENLERIDAALNEQNDG